MQQITLSNILYPFVNDTFTTGGTAKISLPKKFKTWLINQEENRLLWLSIAVLGGIGTVLPLTLLAVIFFANNDFNLWSWTVSINVPVLIVNLAAQPPKVTLPVLFLVWLIDAVIVFYCLASYFIG